MKFTIIFLLAICAVGAYAYPAETNENPLDPEPVADFIKRISAEIGLLTRNAGQMVQLLTDLIAKMASTNVHRVTEHWDEILVNLNKMKKPEAQECIKVVLPEISKAYEVMQDDDQDCLQYLGDQVDLVSNEISGAVQSLKDMIKNLTSIVVDCAMSDEKMKCIQNAQDNVQKVVNKFVLSSEQRITYIYENFFKAADQSSTCILNSFLRFDEIFNKETQKIFECVSAVPSD